MNPSRSTASTRRNVFHPLLVSACVLAFACGAAFTARTMAAAASPRTDSFEEKLKLIEAAWQRKDLDLVRALTHSLRDSAIQAAAESAPLPAPLSPPSSFQTLSQQPASLQSWAAGWNFIQSFQTEETAGLDRGLEPVEIDFACASDQATSLTREIRVARVVEGRIVEVPSQVWNEVRRGDTRQARILILTGSKARERQTFLVFYGNPNAERPDYPSDLKAQGEGVGLDIENEFFKARLSRQTGQLERMTLKREHGLELFSGGEGHGEPPGIDWAHDYVDAGNFQKLRISLWEQCPEYEVVRGPLCTLVRRWGFPRSPVHPLFSPSRLLVDVEYRFYAGLPWFHKIGAMRAVKSFEASALRDDEWVFSGNSFTDPVWMGADNKLHIGEVDNTQREQLWGVGFINRNSHDAFIGLFLEHRAEGLPELKHTGAPLFNYRWHGHVWSRYPLPTNSVPEGAVLRQKNAYTVEPFMDPGASARVEGLRTRLTHPLVARPTAPAPWAAAMKSMPQNPSSRLARPGENGDSPIDKQQIWTALRDCKDAQLYTADINVVDLGLIQDVRLRGSVVTVLMTMPHRGRPLTGYFAQGSISVHPTLSRPILERLASVPGVDKVLVEPCWEPEWSSNRLTEEGRRKLGLEAP